MDRSEIVKKDLQFNWHPYTQMRDCEDMPPIAVSSARGAKLYDYDGNFYYDTISSWWCNVHGHGHPEIRKAVKEQIDSLEHVLFAGFTHLPAVRLAEKLVEVSPEGLTRVFFSDNGSTAVEVALKMSYQSWMNKGISGRRKFVSLDRGYHGDTIGAMSVSGVDLFNKAFEPLFLEAYRAPAPYCYRCPMGRDRDSCSFECVSALEDILKNNRRDICAVIMEPMLLGAGGMIVYPAEYLRAARELTRKYDIHLILDEIATGFGRTAKMFACEHAGVIPDLMCLSKGITSGYLPLGATLVGDDIYSAFYGKYEENRTFYHGHTYTANPVACAAAVASLEIFEKDPVLGNASVVNLSLKRFCAGMRGLDITGDVRDIGAVCAVELVEDKETKKSFDPRERIGKKVYEAGLKKNIVLRPLGDVIYLFLPLCLSEVELADILERTGSVLVGIERYVKRSG